MLCPRHVMIIDDDALVRRSVKRILSTLGVEIVVEAGDGETALALLRDEAHPDAVICDLRMPNIDGITLLRHAAAAGYRGHLIIISGEDDRLIASVADLARGHGLSVIGALEKPVRRSQLETLMAKAANKPAVESLRPTIQTLELADLATLIAGGAVRPFFQPKIDVRSRRIVGVEALCRIEVRPGVVAGPAAFMAVAEAGDLMMDLTIAMVTQSVAQLATWKSAGLDLALAVNVSVDSLKNSQIPEFMGQHLEKCDIAPTRITIEVTETQIAADSRLPMEIFNRLHMMGIKLSIDDFGTGYSSFLQLKSLPFKELKVDRSFVSEALNDRASRAIIEASVTLAQKLGIRVVVEGVETRAEWEFIERLGADEIQGFLIAKPMDGAALTRWMNESTAGGVWRA